MRPQNHSAILLTIFFSFSLLFSSCEYFTGKSEVDSTYIQEIEEWQQARFNRLKKPDGWLSLAGLYWLEEGENTAGADSANNIIFPSGEPIVGTFILDGESVFFRTQRDVAVTFKERLVDNLQVFGKNITELPILQHGSLSWFVLKRGNRVGIRLRDASHPNITKLKKIDRYPTNPDWRVTATFTPYDPPQSIPVANVLGTINDTPSPGVLEFELNGKSWQLQTLDSDDEFFIIFSDDSNGEGTYDAGRYLYTKKPNEEGVVIIDFNKAYNPPCAYTPYATCPLPPQGNHLDLKVVAGEKYEGFLY